MLTYLISPFSVHVALPLLLLRLLFLLLTKLKCQMRILPPRLSFEQVNHFVLSLSLLRPHSFTFLRLPLALSLYCLMFLLFFDLTCPPSAVLDMSRTNDQSLIALLSRYH